MIKDWEVLKKRFEQTTTYWLKSDGCSVPEATLTLPQEGFGFYYIPEMYELEENPDDVLREQAAKAFEEKLNEYYELYHDLGISEIEHYYNKEGIPCYSCTFSINEQYQKNTGIVDETKIASITAHSLDELEAELEHVFENKLGRYRKPHLNDFDIDMSIKNLIKRYPDLNESDEFWWLIDLLVFGTKEAREFARKRIHENIAVSMHIPKDIIHNRLNNFDEKKAKILEKHKPETTKTIDLIKTFEECQKEGYLLAERFYNEAIETGLISSPTALGESVGVNKAYLSKSRRGVQISKAACIRLGIGLHLNSNDMTRFMAAQNYVFPINDDDRAICRELNKKNYDLDKLVVYLPKERTDENKVR